MTIQDIVDAARSWTAISDSGFFSSDDELRSANRAYRDIYERLVDANDDYFLKSQSTLSGDLTDLGRRSYSLAMPEGFYRLRSATILYGDDEWILPRRDVHDRGAGYRFVGNATVTEGEGESETETIRQVMRLWIEQPFDSVVLDYYPAPVEIESADEELVYPPQLEPLILAYQMAIDICNITKDDASRFRAEYQALWDRFERASKKRDNFNRPRVANVYNRSALWGW